MAISKLILNGVTQMDVTSDTVTAGNLVSGIIATKNDGTKVTGSIAFKNATNLTANGSTVTVPSGYYSSQVTKNVASVTHPDPTATFATGTGVFTAAHAQTAGYVAAGTTTSTYALTPKTSANVAISGSAITVSSGYYSAQITKNIATVGNAPIIYESEPSTGLIRAHYSQSAGFVSESYVYEDMSLSVLSAKTYTPGSQTQYVSSYQWLTGSLTINPIPSTYVQPSGTLSISGRGIIEPVGSTILALSSYYYTTVPIIVNPIGNYIASISNSGTLNSYLKITKNDGSAITLSNCGTGFTFNQGDSLEFYAAGTRGGGAIYYNDIAVASSPYNPVTYTLTAPSNNLSISAEYAIDGKIYVNDVAQGGEGFTTDQIAMRTISGSISGNATSICSYAFAYYQQLTSVNFPSATTIDNFAFYYCSNLTTVSFPLVSSLNVGAFYNCSSLTSVSFPSVTAIGNSIFAYCYNLTSVSFPSAKTIGGSAFAYCSNLTSVNFPLVTSIGGSTFRNCYNLTSVNFPLVKSIGVYAFAYCSSLTSVNFPSATTIGSSVFTNCSNLTTVSLPLVTTISNYAFYYCYNLLSLYLLGSSVPSLTNINVFLTTPISNYTTSTGGVYGSIFVPASLYNSYITATNWSVYSARIVSV